MHYWTYRQALKKKRFSPQPKFTGDITLTEWFEYHISRADWICENCGKPIYAPGPDTKFSCQAHILPKAQFKSVALNLDNHLLLGGFMSDCNCHYIYDNSWLKASQMKVFETAISRFLSFKKYLTEQEINRLPEPFVKYL